MKAGRGQRIEQSVYFREHMLVELQREAVRLDRSVHWIVLRCVRLALDDVRALPATPEEDEHG